MPDNDVIENVEETREREPLTPAVLLRSLVDSRSSLQKLRIAAGNRVSAVKRGLDKVPPEVLELLVSLHERFHEAERETEKDLSVFVKKEMDDPLLEHIMSVKGIGPVLAATLISMISFERANSASALQRYAGFGVVDGKRERRVRGQKSSFNGRLKAACRVVGMELKHHNPAYRNIYEKAVEYYGRSHSEWTEPHIKNAALDKVIKLFLSHLWMHGRIIRGLSISKPYPFAIMGHDESQYISPEECGWEAIS